MNRARCSHARMQQRNSTTTQQHNNATTQQRNSTSTQQHNNVQTKSLFSVKKENSSEEGTSSTEKKVFEAMDQEDMAFKKIFGRPWSFPGHLRTGDS